jgi:predicted RNA-binding Zn-ribbon protein involved in translation (DUF1610 family)
MKNSELLSQTCGNQLLTALDSQRRYVLRIEQGPFACPNCGVEHAKWEIHGITDVNDYDLSAHHGDEGKCKSCGRGIRYCVGLIGGSFFSLIPDPELARGKGKE